MEWVWLLNPQSIYIYYSVCVCVWIYLWCVDIWICGYIGELLRIRASKFRTQFQHSLVLWSRLLIVLSSSLKDDNNFSINVTRMLSIKSCQISIFKWFTNHKYYKIWGSLIQAVCICLQIESKFFQSPVSLSIVFFKIKHKKETAQN